MSHVSRKHRYKNKSQFLLGTVITKPFKKTLLALVDGLIHQTLGDILVTKAILQQLGVLNIYLFDSTIITLIDSASKHFKGVKSKSGIKVHACINLFTGSLEWFKLTESKCHDRPCFPEINLFTGSLVIFDLGYFDYQLMLVLINMGAFYLCRLKDKSVVHITEVLSGLPSTVVGQSLLKACKPNKYYGNIIEVNIQKSLDGKQLNCRAIGFWNSTDKYYHWYLTNLLVPAKLIYILYCLRWQIELFFKSCKSTLNLDEIGSANPVIIENLILASIAAHLASQIIRNIVSPTFSDEQNLAITFQRIAIVFCQLRQHFITYILNPITENLKALVDKILFMKSDLYDPNYKKRETSKMALYRMLNEAGDSSIIV